jgi:citrate lyase subunit beta/citryl-CoA lyase
MVVVRCISRAVSDDVMAYREFMTDCTATPPAPFVPAELARSWVLRSAVAALDPVPGDALVIDLEDGLPTPRKVEGRLAAGEFLQHSPAWVRVNAPGTDHWADDLALLSTTSHLSGVVLAMTESAAHVEATAQLLPAGTRIIPLIESAIGLERALSIASHPSTFRLAFGSGDFRRDTGMADDPIVLSWPRARLVVASAAAGIAAPIDGPTLGDAEAVLAAACHACDMGMTGKLVLRDEHVPAANEGLSPAPHAITQATALLARAGGDASDGSYAPARARAQRLLDRAEAFGLLTTTR